MNLTLPDKVLENLYSGMIMTLGLGKQCQPPDGSRQQHFEETRAMRSLDADEHYVPCSGYKVDTHSLIVIGLFGKSAAWALWLWAIVSELCCQTNKKRCAQLNHVKKAWTDSSNR